MLYDIWWEYEENREGSHYFVQDNLVMMVVSDSCLAAQAEPVGRRADNSEIVCEGVEFCSFCLPSNICNIIHAQMKLTNHFVQIIITF